MRSEDIRRHRSICVMGLGSTFAVYREWLLARFDIHCIADNDPGAALRHPEHAHVPSDALHLIDDPFVIVTTSLTHYRAIDAQLTAAGIPHCLLYDIDGFAGDNHPVIRLSTLAAPYADALGNTIDWEGDSPPDGLVGFGVSGRDGRRPSLARGNRLFFRRGTTLVSGCDIRFLGNGSSVEIGSQNWLGHGVKITVGSDSLFRTGDRCTFESLDAILHEGRIVIGDDCMFSVRIHLRQTDSHPVFDAATGLRLNAGKHIDIGHHVWVGFEAFLLGGFGIGDDSIVGARAVSSGRFPGGAIVAGSPARVVREGITWRKDDLLDSPPDLSRVTDCRLY